jgi:outer membrane receptor protein involved in Fe transport
VETATTVTSFPASRYDGLRNQSNAVYFQDYVRIHPKLQLLVGGRFDAYQHYDFLNPVVGGAVSRRRESVVLYGRWRKVL